MFVVLGVGGLWSAGGNRVLGCTGGAWNGAYGFGSIGGDFALSAYDWVGVWLGVGDSTLES